MGYSAMNLIHSSQAQKIMTFLKIKLNRASIWLKEKSIFVKFSDPSISPRSGHEAVIVVIVITL